MSRGVTRVYVGNLGSNGVKSEIEREFSKFGVIRDVWVARNPPGFAFVEFDDHRDADDAIKELNGRRICGVRVQVELSNHQGRTSRKPPPANRGRSRYSPDDRYGDRYAPPRGRYEDERYGSSFRESHVEGEEKEHQNIMNGTKGEADHAVLHDINLQELCQICMAVRSVF